MHSRKVEAMNCRIRLASDTRSLSKTCQVWMMYICTLDQENQNIFHIKVHALIMIMGFVSPSLQIDNEKEFE